MNKNQWINKEKLKAIKQFLNETEDDNLEKHISYLLLLKNNTNY